MTSEPGWTILQAMAKDPRSPDPKPQSGESPISDLTGAEFGPGNSSSIMSSAEDILEFAIEREQDSYLFYTRLAERASHEEIKKALREFADEEREHEVKLIAVKTGRVQLKKPSEGQEIISAQYIVEDEPSDDMDFSDAVHLAMRREKAAFRLYSDLAAQALDGQIRDLFLGLALEEARHKLVFEIALDRLAVAEH